MRIDKPEDLGHWVRDRRGALGWTQARLGQKIGSTRFWVADLEAGKPTLELALVLKAVHALGAVVDVRTPQPSSQVEAPGSPRTPVGPRIDLDAIVDGGERGG